MKRNPITVLSYGELVDTISGVGDGEHRAFLSLLYLTGARVSEIVKRVRAGDIEVFKEDDDTYLKVRNMPILKRRLDKEVTRHPEILLNGREATLAGFVQDYAKNVNKGLLFDFTRQTGYNWVHKDLGLWPHYLRHARITHLAEYADFDPADLQKFIGWSDLKSAGKYTHLSMKKLRHKLKTGRLQ